MKVRNQPKLRRVKPTAPTYRVYISQLLRYTLELAVSIVAIIELIRGAQCLIEVIRSFGEEM
jgi:hypothetical protein